MKNIQKHNNLLKNHKNFQLNLLNKDIIKQHMRIKWLIYIEKLQKKFRQPLQFFMFLLFYINLMKVFMELTKFMVNLLLIYQIINGKSFLMTVLLSMDNIIIFLHLVTLHIMKVVVFS